MSVNPEYRKSFLKVLEELFYLPFDAQEDPSTVDVLKLIFGNLTSPANFPNSFGAIDESITHLISFTQFPNEEEQIQILHVLLQLLKHKWALKAFFQNAAGIKFALSRNPKSSLQVAELKFELVKWVVVECPWTSENDLIDPVIATQLQTYYTNGVFGIGGQEEMELATI